MKLFNADPWYPWLQGMYVKDSHWTTTSGPVAQKDLIDMYNSEHPRCQASNQAFTKMFKALGFVPANGRGHHWHMMKYEDFKTNMIANNKWDEYM
jgi:hypothetical protein